MAKPYNTQEYNVPHRRTLNDRQIIELAQAAKRRNLGNQNYYDTANRLLSDLGKIRTYGLTSNQRAALIGFFKNHYEELYIELYSGNENATQINTIDDVEEAMEKLEKVAVKREKQRQAKEQVENATNPILDRDAVIL